MKVYTKIKDKLAVFEVETEDADAAIKAVQDQLKISVLKQRNAVLAVVK